MIVKPFAALMPIEKHVKECAALPYDVMSSSEAREETKNKPYSFLHIDKAEIDLDPTIDLYDERVYQKAKENLQNFEKIGVYAQSKQKKFYFYRQIMNGIAQTGIVGCASIDDYISEKIKKHELTRADKELDRIRHVDTCSAQTGPIFLAYKDSNELDCIIQRATQTQPLFDFVADDGIRHTVWESDSCETDLEIENAFKTLSALYIADGHHRAASAVKAGLIRREANAHFTGEEEFNYFLSVIFPANSLKIFDYNRLLRDLNGMNKEEFLNAVERNLGKVEALETNEPYRPESVHTIGLYLNKKWHKVTFKKELCEDENPANRLDCAILQKYLLSPVLNQVQKTTAFCLPLKAVRI